LYGNVLRSVSPEQALPLAPSRVPSDSNAA